MGRGHFRNTLASCVSKKEAAAAAAETSGDEIKKQAARKPATVFDDVTVCRYLGIRRRVLDAARTASARGTDWDCVDDHAGMTKAWIDAYALQHHLMPNFNIKLTPITSGDGVVSVRLIGTHPNLEMCGVEKLSDGSRMFAHVRNLLTYPIHFREGFDCRQVGTRLEWVHNLNDVIY